MILKKSISYFMNIMYKHIFLNFGVISFINKEIVSFIQLHTYKFGLVYLILKARIIEFAHALTRDALRRGSQISRLMRKIAMYLRTTRTQVTLSNSVAFVVRQLRQQRSSALCSYT